MWDYDSSEQSNVAMEDELHIYNLHPAPPKVKVQECIDLYFSENDEKYLEWTLHCYEKDLNNISNGIMWAYYMPGHFSEIKSACATGVLLALKTYNPQLGVPFKKYTERFIEKEIHDYVRTMRTGFTVQSSGVYLNLRKIMWLYHQNGDKIDSETMAAMVESVKRSEKTVLSILTGGLNNENIVDFYKTYFDEDGENSNDDVTRELSFEPSSLFLGMEQRKSVMESFDELDYRERDILSAHFDFCPECFWIRHDKATFAEIAYNNELSSAEAAEVACRKALDKLIVSLQKKGFCHSLRLKRKANSKNSGEIISYMYQVDGDGAWGEIRFDTKTNEFNICSLADYDLIKSRPYAKIAIRHIREMVEAGTLLKERLWAVW